MKKAHNVDYSTLNLRIGIHTGNMIAGFIGSKVVKYDIFGDTVMVTSRLKSAAPPSKVCLSEATKNMLETSSRAYKLFEYEDVGLVHIKPI